MRGRSLSMMIAAFWALSGGGCASPQAPGAQPLSRSLVLPGPGLRTAGASFGNAEAWEYGRNDAVLGRNVKPPESRNEWAEIRTHDGTRTDNGRPREYSRTLIRTVRIQRVP